MVTQTFHWRIAAIVCLALAVRLWGTGFGLPYDLTPDEPHQILQALKIGAGDGGPLVRIWHTIGKGGLDYLLFLEYALLYCVWFITGKVGSPDDFALVFLQDPTVFYLLGRGTVALLGALTCLAIYGTGRLIYSERIGLLGALIGALALDHATDSHLINVHIPMAFALWASLWSYAHHERAPTGRSLILTGVLAGLAVSLAYNAIVGLLLLALAIATRTPASLPSGGRVRTILQVLAIALATLFLLAPDLLFGAGALLQNFQQILGQTPEAAALTGPRATIDDVTILREQRWRDYLPILFGPRNVAVTLAAVVGVTLGIARRERWTCLLAGTTTLLILLLSASDRGASERYLLPMVPALWLLAARGVVGLAGLRHGLQLALILAIVVPSAVQIVRADYSLTLTDTRVLAKHWIETHIEPGSRLLVDGMRFRFIQSPPLKPSAEALERQLAALQASELNYPPRFLALYREAKSRLPGPAYDLYSTLYGLALRAPEYYVEACFDYVVVSSDVAKRYAVEPLRSQHPQAARFYADIRSHPAFRSVYALTGEAWTRPGPGITVYAVQPGCADQGESLPTVRNE